MDDYESWTGAGPEDMFEETVSHLMETVRASFVALWRRDDARFVHEMLTDGRARIVVDTDGARIEVVKPPADTG